MTEYKDYKYWIVAAIAVIFIFSISMWEENNPENIVGAIIIAGSAIIGIIGVSTTMILYELKN